MDLVVEKFALLLRPRLVGELAAADSVADGDSGLTHQVKATGSDQLKSDFAHDRVKDARVGV